MKRAVASIAVGGFVVLASAGSASATEVSVAPINVAGSGLVPVTLTDAEQVDTANLELGGVAPAVPVRPSTDGTVVAHFDKQQLVDAGVLTPHTEKLTIAGKTADVSVNVELEVKLAPGGAKSRVRSVAGPGRLEPLVTDVDFNRLKSRARSVSGRSLPDMSLWQRLTLPADTDPDEAIKDLLASGQVTDAYVAPSLTPPPQELGPTPDFTSMQGYLRLAPQGIDADFSRLEPRARGAGVRIADLEYYWTHDHEDLQLDPVATDLGGAAFPQYRNFNDEHGTAVFGEMVAKDNGYGVTGGVPDASMHGISPNQRTSSGGTRYNTAAALTYVAQFLSPGDVVLVEQQTGGPNGSSAYVPIEWTQANFDAIRALSDLGIVVMETGGNGGQNLDGPEFQGRFDRSVRDSGAIIGGAGSATTHAALNYSSHGARVELQGWGEQITTTGSGGNLFGGNGDANRTRRYTRSFSGTSGAGPIVTNALVGVQSYLKATGRAPYTSRQLIDLLTRTGTPQTGERHIGPLPNLREALKEIEVDGPVTTASFSPADVNGWYLNPTITISADDGWGVGVRSGSIEYRIDGGEWQSYSGPFQVLAPGEHTLETRAEDLKGNSAINTTTFNVYDLDTEVEGTAAGTVAATLSLSLSGAASFGAFTPGLEQTYSATTTATIVSTAGDAALTVSDPSAAAPGHLVNGGFSLDDALEASATSPGGTSPGAFAPISGDGLGLLTYAGPIANDPVAIAFRQRIAASQPLRTGTYSKTLTFTLSTTTP